MLFGGILCLAFAAIAITIAYNRDSSVLANNFELGGIYKTVTTEEFIGPDNWQPCQEVPKTVTVKNEGDVDVAVRISYEEYWRDKDDIRLSSVLDDVNLVDIVFQNESDWELIAGYYYYKHTLAPGESSNSLFKKVVLNCDADFGDDNICTETPTGTECVAPEKDQLCLLGDCISYDYRSAKYHLKIKVETIQSDKASIWRTIGYEVDQIPGLTQLSENGQPVHMFTREKDGNNVIWSNFCWKIVRTTYTGGVKMIYAGSPMIEDGARVCPQSGSGITVGGSNTFAFDVGGKTGYMHGDTISTQAITLEENDTTTSFILSNGVARNGDTYTLDTSTGQFIEGAGVDLTPEAQTRYHYFCTDGSSSCDSSKIGYLTKIINTNYPDRENPYIIIDPSVIRSRKLVYYPLGGYDDVDDLKSALFDNKYDSSAKTIVESWFEANNLDDDALEDAIYCSDRGIASGSLAGPEANIGRTSYASLARKKNPTLDCASKNDSFTKDDTTNGNGKLSHKVGLLTADEMSITGLELDGDDYTVVLIECRMGTRNSFLGSYSHFWSMTPTSEMSVAASEDSCYSEPDVATAANDNALNPVVSLKGEAMITGGTGLLDDPYIVE